jgi:hypothetical protein
VLQIAQSSRNPPGSAAEHSDLLDAAKQQNESNIDDTNMPGGRRVGGGFNFVGKPPLAFRALEALLIANTFGGLLFSFGAKYFLPTASVDLPPCEALSETGAQLHAPGVICWLADHFIAIQFVLIGLIAATMVIYHKRVVYVPAPPRPRNTNSWMTIAVIIVLVSIVIWVALSQAGWLR